MSANNASQQIAGDGLKSELARYCLPAANRDSNRNVAWVNSICILFLLIGILGSKPAVISAKKPPPIEEVIPTIIQQLPPPPATAEEQKQDQTDRDKPETPNVVVVTPEAPNINFSVPTVGNLLVASSLAAAPPLNPQMAPAALKNLPASLSSTGEGGDRPSPSYPKIAEEEGMAGTVVLLLTADEAGNITSAEVKTSSGYPMLDHSALEYVKRHWTVPPGTGIRLFEAPITYKLNQ